MSDTNFMVYDKDDALTMVVDMDGTIADCMHRVHHVRPVADPVTGIKPKKNWMAFKDGIAFDAPIQPVIDLVKAMKAQGWNIVVSSGRGADTMPQTVDWFIKHVGFRPHAIFMRRVRDYRDDGIVKVELLAQMRDWGFDPYLWLDDRQRVVDALRAVGVKVLQCAPGNF